MPLNVTLNFNKVSIKKGKKIAMKCVDKAMNLKSVHTQESYSLDTTTNAFMFLYASFHCK